MSNAEFKHVWAITAHGESPCLEECICSVKNQTLCSNIIICTATDNELIRNLAQKYDVCVYVRQGKDDMRENWNYAYNVADGTWVTLAHQDDIYNEHYVEELKRCVEKTKNASIFFSEYEPFGGKSKTMQRNRIIQKILKFPLRFKLLANKRIVKCLTLALGNSICCPTVSFNKTFLGENIFLVDDAEYIKENIDWQLWIRLAKEKNMFVYSTKTLLKYRYHSGQVTASYMQNERRYDEDYKCFRLIWPEWIAKLLMKFYKKSYNIY